MGAGQLATDHRFLN